MKKSALILRDAAMQTESRGLRRPAKMAHSPPHTSRPRPLDGQTTPVANALASGAVAAGRSDAAATLDSSSLAASTQSALAEQRYEEGRLAGYQEALRTVQDKAQREIELKASQLAKQMLEERIREAIAQAEQTAMESHRRQQAQLEQQREAYAKLIRSVQTQLHARMADCEDDIVAIAFELMCKVLGDQAVTSEGLAALVGKVLQGWQGRSALSIHLHPDDLAMVQSDAQWLTHIAANAQNLGEATPQLVGDPAIGVGGCVLQSSEGALDGRLEFQLQALKQAIIRTRAARHAQGASAGLRRDQDHAPH